MNVVFRVDASASIGNGHFMRCLALAEALKDCHSQVWFLCLGERQNIYGKVEQAGHQVILIDGLDEAELDEMPRSFELGDSQQGDDQRRDAHAVNEKLERLRRSGKNIDWIIVDGYQFDKVWHDTVNKAGGRLLVIDDLSNRDYECDLLVDQTVGKHKQDYETCVNQDAHLLVGSEYALLRKEFQIIRQTRIDPRVNRSPQESIQTWKIMISLGGTDPDNISMRILLAIADLPIVKQLTVVLAGNAPHGAELGRYIARHCAEVVSGKTVPDKTVPEKIRLKIDVNNMAELIAEQDLVIGASGTTSLERFCLGVPAITVTTAVNQETVARNTQNLGASIHLGCANELDAQVLREAVIELFKCPDKYQKVKSSAYELCDGQGAKRVVDMMQRLTYSN